MEKLTTPKFMNKLKIYIIAALTTALSMAANAAPLSPNISGPINGVGSYRIIGASKVSYQVSYDSGFGGRWNLSGTHTEPGYHGQQYFEDSFSGTISDTSLSGTFTSADFSWLSDVYLYCLPPIGRIVHIRTPSRSRPSLGKRALNGQVQLQRTPLLSFAHGQKRGGR